MITLYDVASRPGSQRGWNPMPARIRYSLNFKQLPFKTVWLEYPDIEPTLKMLGAAPTMKWPDGRPFYTVPVIVDESHLTENGEPTIVPDPWAIVKYLDETYSDPGIPKLLPNRTAAMQMLCQRYLFENLHLGPLAHILTPYVMNVLSEPSQKYHREAREKIFNTTFEELCPRDSDKWKEQWNNTKKAFDKIATFLDQNGSGNRTLFMEGQPSYIDFVLVSYLAIILPDQWELMRTWNDGRWENLRTICARWNTIDITFG